MSPKLNINGRKLLTESFTIIVSVLFAFFINEWRNNYKENQRTEVILENIKKEMNDNLAITKYYVDYHNEIEKNIDKILANDTLINRCISNDEFNFYEVAPNGIIQKTQKNIAWEVAMEEKITNRINFELSQTLFEVYHQQEFINITINKLVDLVSSRKFHRREMIVESLKILQIQVHNLLGMEINLKKKIDKALIAIENIN